MKAAIISGMVALLVGAGLGYYLVPTKVVEKTKIVDKIITTKDVKIVKVIKPDGTVVITYVDKSKIDENKNTDKSKTTERKNLDWVVSGVYMRNLSGQNEIVGSIYRRVIGEIYVGVAASNRGYVGAGLQFRF